MLRTALTVFIVCCMHFVQGGHTGSYRNPPECEGASCNYVASWVLDVHSDVVNFSISANTIGWVAIGFSETPSMLNSDIIMGAKLGDLIFVTDRYATMYGIPNEDMSLEGSHDISLISINSINGNTSLVFQRPRNSEDPNDLSLNECVYFIFAWNGFINENGTPFYHSRNRAVSDTTVCIEA